MDLSLNQERSSAQNALAIPELLAHIIAFLERKFLLKPALVNRYWCEIALNRLWESLPELTHLVRILHPLRWSKRRESWVLVKNAPAPDWARFDYYGRRIREISHPDHRRWGMPATFLPFHLSSDVFSLLSSRGPLPDNIQRIRFGVRHQGRDILLLPPLLHSNVKRLRIENEYGCDLPSLAKVFEDLSKVPGLQLEHFHWLLMLGTQLDSSVLDVIAPFLDSQIGLEKLEITESYVTGPRTIQAITRLSNLRTLHLRWFDATETSLVNDVVSRLTEGCPCLKEFRVHWYVNEPHGVPFNFRPLFKWDLEVIEIGEERGAALQVEDVREMGKAWPRLRQFAVNPSNNTVGDSPNVELPLSALSIIANSWPNLEVLNTVFEWKEDLATVQTDSRFRNLRELAASEWYLPEDKVTEVALYLKSLGVTPYAICHALIMTGYNSPDMQARYEANRDRWRTLAARMRQL